MRRRRHKIHAVIFAVYILGLCLLVGCVSRPDPIAPAYTTLPDGSKLIENQVFNQQINLVGEEYSNLVIRNCVIEDLPYNHSGIYIRDVHDVTIENCTIRNLRGFWQGGGRGIRISSRGDSRRVTIQDNFIENIESDGIAVAQTAESGDQAVNRGVKILNNHISRIALARRLLFHGRMHGIYCQSPDFLIEGNRIGNVGDGNGISVRSSGVISKNIVSAVGAGDPIRYFNDHPWLAGSSLIIENNILYDESYENGQRAMLSLVYDSAHAGFLGDDFLIRFNTLVALDGRSAPLWIDARLAANTKIIGNLFYAVDDFNIPKIGYVVSGNYISDALDHFVSGSTPYDFHLESEHGAVGFAAGISSWPKTDIDGDARAEGLLDAGADQTVQHRQ